MARFAGYGYKLLCREQPVFFELGQSGDRFWPDKRRTHEKDNDITA
jgi:hypothetical protein